MKPSETDFSLTEELERLRAENARLNAFIEHASDAFIVLDEHRTIVQMNEAAKRLTGFYDGQGLRCGDLFNCRDEQGQALREELCFGRCSIEHRRSIPYEEMVLTHPDGHEYPVSVSYSYIPLADGRFKLLMVMRDLTLKKRLEKELLMKNELEITLKERERLSRDLHDGVVQSLAFLGLKSKMALSQLESEQVERVKSSLVEITEVVQESYGEIRQALFDLRTLATEDLGKYLGEYLQNFSLQTKIKATLEVDEQFPKVTNERTSIHVLKVVQEAIANVRKHAQASQVTVRLINQGNVVQISIIDDGRGFNVSEPTDDGIVHYGLTTMEERIHLIGGQIVVHSEVSKGTEVSLLIPLELLK